MFRASNKGEYERWTNRASRSAFSLVELMTVIAIGALLTTVSMSAFSQISHAGNLTKAGSDISDLLERARAHAMAQKTYVWVGFSEGENDSLRVGVAASRRGVANPGPDDVVILDRLRSYPNTRIVSLPEADSRPAPSGDAQVADLTSAIQTFSVGGSNPITFDKHVVQFNSRGESRIVAAQPYRIAEIGLQEFVNGKVRNAANFAAIQIGGFSGAVSLYRP